MKKYIIMFACIGSFLNITEGNSAELNCVKGAALGADSAADCEALGYTMTSIATSREPDKDIEICGDGRISYCPSDKTKIFCTPKSPLPILYGDGSLSNFILKNKTPVAIVFDEMNKLAVALTNVKQDGTPGDENMPWSSVTGNTPIMDCTYSSYKNEICGKSGRLNTNVLLKETSGTYYAAKAVNAYQPKGCTADFCKKGKWFLPSLVEYTRYYRQFYLLNVSGAILASPINMEWLSSENSSNYAYAGYVTKNKVSDSAKQSVRPIVYYGSGDIVLPVQPILYGDGTVSKTPVSGKTPIGIVFDETKRLAIALTDIKKNGTAGSETMRWGRDVINKNTSLKNCKSEDLDTCDPDGRTNTTTILKLVSSTDENAFNAVNKFEPSGCSAAFCKKTKWFLPSMREWRLIESKEIESTGALNVGTAFKRFIDGSYWASNESGDYKDDGTYAWTTDKDVSKSLNTYVRPAIKY